MTTATSAPVWRLRTRELVLERPCVMGIVNVTPDSFSDGGRLTTTSAAVEHARRLLDEGADIVDIGGESTRPGATPVSPGDELARVLPVIAALRAERPDVVISIDTVKADVAAAALDAGADIVNDVSAFRLDARMADVCARADAGVVLMHSRGTVADMASYAHATYDDVIGEVVAELQHQVDDALVAGIASERIVVDPGLGFSKRAEQSMQLLAHLDRFAEAMGRPVLVGASRKRFIGDLSGVKTAADRVYGTVAAHAIALIGGARIFRVHDVAAARQSLDVAWGLFRTRAEMDA